MSNRRFEVFHYRQALLRMRQGERHPNTLTALTNLIILLTNVGQIDAAVRRLRELEPALLDRLAAELYSTESVAVRRSLVASQATLENLALTLAIAYPEHADVQRMAGFALLRFKGLLAEEEAYLAHLSRRNEDPRVRVAAFALTDALRTLAEEHTTGQVNCRDTGQSS